MASFRTRSLWVLWLVTATLGACATPAFVPSPEACRALAPAQRAWVGDRADWSPYLAHVRACNVRGPGGASALLVVSVWADLLYAATPGPATTIALPLPLLLDRNGRELGTLPANFPSDPPAELELRFSQWRDGRPHRIGLCLRSPAAGGDQPLPALRFDPASGRYSSTRSSTLRGDCDGR